MVDQLFAVEHYDDTGNASEPDLPRALPPGVRLSAGIHLPADDVVIAFVAGETEETVRAAVTAAGWRVDRITPASWLTPVTASDEEHPAAPAQ